MVSRSVDWRDLWIKAVAPDEPHKLQRRLAWDNLTEDGLEAWLKGVSPSIDGASIGWQQALRDCTEALQASWDLPLLQMERDDQRAFVDIWWPIRCLAAEHLEGAFSSRTGDLRIDLLVYRQLADCLLDRLCSIGDQVLWESFHAERNPGMMLTAHLGASGDGSGGPVREDYEAFTMRHRRDGLEALLVEFPVLGRFIGTAFALWFQGSVDMLQRICADRAVLESKFSIPVHQPISAVQQGLSDPHRGGRAVAILTFAGSAAQTNQVVYKPKDMGVDAAYQAVLTDLNSNSDLAPLRTLAIHAANGYGYMEFVPHRLCADEQELRRFYTNAGRLTAVLHLLGCTDCHDENLIACGDQLILIDTETLLEPDLPDHVAAASSQPEVAIPSDLQKRIQQSVLRSGLLPQWMFLGNEKQPVDISALGIAPPSRVEQKVDGWLGLNTDGMMPGRVNRVADIPTSLPVGVGQSNPFGRFLDAFTQGFLTQSHDLIGRRKHWLTANGVLSLFAGLPRRIVLRNTRVYFVIQRQQLKPAALRSPLAQALKLEQLARSFLLAETKPQHWPVFAADVEQMQQLDIPFFTHLIDGDALVLDGAGEGLPGFIQTSGLKAAYERLQTLDSEEIDFQLRLIRGAVEARNLRPATETAPGSEQINDPQIVSESLLKGNGEAVRKIVERLLELSIRDPQGHVEWLGVDLGSDAKSFTYGPVGLSLYGGSIGIACLLHCLQGQSVQFADADDISTAILRPLHALIDQPTGDGLRRWWRDQPLGLSGCGGILLALIRLGEQELAEMLLKAALPRYIESDRQLDVIGGCAGLIGPLLQLGTEQALHLAILAGDHLIARQGDHGAWDASAWQLPLLGFSHGTAGYAASLARLHQATQEPRFRKAAFSALTYERARFSKEKGNWPDFRLVDKHNDTPGFMVGWCHGAPGIALGRACLWGTELWDEQCTEEIAIALQTTAAKRSLGADHLCCGTLGLMVILQTLAKGSWPMDDNLRTLSLDAADKHRQRALKRSMVDKVELRCFGTREGTLILPGFFTGLSGMGLALLENQQSQEIVSQFISAGLWPDLRGTSLVGSQPRVFRSIHASESAVYSEG